MVSPQVSIITTAYASERLGDLVELLDSIAAQTYQNIQTIIVAERSPELAQSIKDYIAGKGYRMLVLYNDGEWGASAARNLALERASGDIIALVDDDALLFADWAEETVKTYRQDGAAISVTGPILPQWEKPADWFPREFYWIFSCTYWDMAGTVRVRNGYGTNLSFRREAFASGERFNTSLGVKGRGQQGWQEPGAEEVEFSLRVQRRTGKHTLYNPRVRVRHKVYGYRLTTGFIARRAYWEGYAKAMLNRRYRPVADEVVLSTEYELLRRILFRLLPGVAGRLFRRPAVALRQLLLSAIVLVCVAGGYLGYQGSRLFGGAKAYDVAPSDRGEAAIP